jgi:hypothetical protein
MVDEGAAGAEARLAWIRPRFAPATAQRTRALQRHLQRDHGPEERVPAGQRDVEHVDGLRLPEELVAYALGKIADRREIDRHLVREAFVLRQSFACQDPSQVVPSTRIMPEVRECPLCGSSMAIKLTQTAAYIPGQSEAAVRTTAEWICPDCDYYEEAEEERT